MSLGESFFTDWLKQWRAQAEATLAEILKEVRKMAGETAERLTELEAAQAALTEAISGVSREVGQVLTRIDELLAQIAADPANAARVQLLTEQVQTQVASIRTEVERLDAASGVPDA